MNSKKDICFGETFDADGWMSISTNEHVRLLATIAKLRAFVEEVAKYDTRRGAGGWNFPTERALKAQQLLKEIDG